MSQKLSKKSEKKHRCWQRYIETRSEQKFTEYRRLSNQVKNLTKKAKKHKERSIAKEAKCNSKKFWQYVNGKTRIRQGIPDLVYSGEDGEERNTTNDKENAEVLSSFFTSVFTNENMQDIPDVPTKKFDAVLKDVKISKDRIRKKILSLNIAKSPGPDRVHPKLLKELAEIILEPLEKMFNLNLQSSKMPEEWKIGEISAIFKKGNRRSPMNYRPVSLTSTVCKLLESLVREEIISHMRSNKLFSPYQYGFIDKRSTTLQLLYVFRQMDRNHWWWRDNRCHIHGLHEGLWQGATWTSPRKGRSLWHRRATAGMDKKFRYRKKTKSKSGRRFI